MKGLDIEKTSWNGKNRVDAKLYKSYYSISKVDAKLHNSFSLIYNYMESLFKVHQYIYGLHIKDYVKIRVYSYTSFS